MYKIMTILGTRPDLIKMSRVINELDEHVNHILVHTGQNYDYELNQVFFEDLNIREPDYFLDAVGIDAMFTIAKIIEKTSELLKNEKPDAVMFYGDTNSCLAVIPAKRMKIPVFHMEAGNRCFDQRVPEELNRKIIDHLSDINFVLTEHARRYLLAEGIKPEMIVKTGSHMREVLNFYMPKIVKSDVLNRLNLKSKQFFLVSAHREENVDISENLLELIESLNAVADKYKFPILFSTHPRTKKRLDDLNIPKINSLINFVKPFGFTDYIKLQIESLCVLSDSGTITEEASILNFKAITIRNAHERPEGTDAGTLIMTGLKKNRILDAVEVIISQPETVSLIPDYQMDSPSRQILRVVMSYIEYINRNIWHK
jgi:UDP-N-acetylglucosamine 2-epimerase